MLKLQGDIAQSVAEELQLVLTPDELAKVTKRATENPKAYQEYLQGRIEWKKRSEQGFASAIQHFEKAIELDPNFALAYSGLADIYFVYPYWQVEFPSIAYPKARANAEKAKELDETLAEPWTTLAAIEWAYFDWDKSEKLLVHAINLNKNYANARHWRAGLHIQSGNPQLATQYARKSLELDPISPINYAGLAYSKLYTNELDETISLYEKAYKLSNNENKSFIAMIARAYLRMNQAQKGIQIIDQFFEDVTQNTRAMAVKARCEVLIGNKVRALELLNTMLHWKATGKKYISEHFIADIYAELGDKEKAFYWLAEAADNMAPHCALFHKKSVYDQWKDEPEYKALLKKTNLDKS
jgi:serine/threonine-protein kinase